ncbi:MAG: hypothetical protein P8J89_03605 [Phycisphaerales bacterium]|nr:hypothetical protein [Phycisphaerales bacterium]|tara:strand:+ start:7646 stop:8824 length:1179 start_codon:yes stop_codon:yes gene_type:complete
MKKNGTNLAAIVSLLLLCGPVVLSPFFFARNRSFINGIENRELTGFPDVRTPDDLLLESTWEELSAWLEERVPFRGDVIMAKSWADTEFLLQRRFGRVDRGDDGWLFFRDSYGLHWRQEANDVADAVTSLDAFIARHADSKASFRLLLLPDKHTIYPEHLTEDGRRDVATVSDDRARLQRRFAVEDDSHVIDIHGAMLQAKSQGDHELYFRDDTHQNLHGALVMTRAIIDSLLPGAWDGDHVLLTNVYEKEGDLRKMIGSSVKKPLQYDMLAIYRPGVHVSRIEFEDQLYTDFSTIDAQELAWRLPLKIQYRSDESLPMVPGRTLLLHDSCIGSIARPLLRSFFNDITFKHYKDMTSSSMHQAMMDYDNVIVQFVERHAPLGMNQFLMDPDH